MSNESFSNVTAQNTRWSDEVLIRADDFLVLVIGPTGTGKSSFINRVVGERVMAVGHRLTSCTTEVAWVSLQVSGHRVILVDTPGIDDTFENNVSTVQTILQWLEKSCPKDVHFGGIIYFQNIANPRFSTLSQQELEMLDASFKEAKESIVPRITLVTSMWNKVDEADGTKREQELKNEQWNTMLQQGANLHRFDNSEESARKILETAIFQGLARIPNLQKYIQDFQVRQKALQERKDNMLVRIGQKMKNLRNKTEQKGKPDLLLGNPPIIDITITRSDTRASTVALENNADLTLSNPIIDLAAANKITENKSKRGIPFIGKKRQKASPAPAIASPTVSNGQGSRSSNITSNRAQAHVHVPPRGDVKPEDQSSVSNSVRTMKNHNPEIAASGSSGLSDTPRPSSDDLTTMHNAVMNALNKTALDSADLDKAAAGTTQQLLASKNQDRSQESARPCGVEPREKDANVPKKKSSKAGLPKEPEVDEFRRTGEDIQQSGGEKKIDDDASFRYNAANNCESRSNTIPFVSSERYPLTPSLKSSHSISSEDTSFSSAKSKIDLTLSIEQDKASITTRTTIQETSVENPNADEARDNVEGNPNERHEKAELPTQQKSSLVQSESERGPDLAASSVSSCIEGKGKQQQDSIESEVTKVLQVLTEYPTSCNAKYDSMEVASPGAWEAPTPMPMPVDPTPTSPIENMSSIPGQAESTSIQARNTPKHFNDELPASGSEPVTMPVQLTSLYGELQMVMAKADSGTVAEFNLQKSEAPSETQDRDTKPKDDIQNNGAHLANPTAKPSCASAIVARTDHIPEAQTIQWQSKHEKNTQNETKNSSKPLDEGTANFPKETISQITESRIQAHVRQKVDKERYLMALRPSASL